MDSKQIEVKVKEIVGEYIKQSFSSRDDIVSLGVGSTQTVAIVLDLEKTFNIRISDAEAKNLRTITAISTFIAGKILTVG